MEAPQISALPLVPCKMKQRNVRRALQTTVLCLSLVYLSSQMVWTVSSTSSASNQSDISNGHSEPISRHHLQNYRNRQLKNHESNEIFPELQKSSNNLNQPTEADSKATQSPSSSKLDLRPVKSGISLDDIFLSVKTTRIFHQSRLEVILNTWFRLARNQVRARFLFLRRFGTFCLALPVPPVSFSRSIV